MTISVTYIYFEVLVSGVNKRGLFGIGEKEIKTLVRQQKLILEFTNKTDSFAKWVSEVLPPDLSPFHS